MGSVLAGTTSRICTCGTDEAKALKGSPDGEEPAKWRAWATPSRAPSPITATGPIVLAGLRFGGETLSVGGEIRYHAAEGDLNSDFAGNKIDLGGWTYNFTIGVRFGR